METAATHERLAATEHFMEHMALVPASIAGLNAEMTPLSRMNN